MITAEERRIMREDHEALMDSWCKISESAGWVFDQAEQVEVQAATDPYYEGRCKVQAAYRRSDKPVIAGEEPTNVTQYVVVIPWDNTTPEPGHTVQVTLSPDPRNCHLFTIVQVEGNDFLSARRLVCTENM